MTAMPPDVRLALEALMKDYTYAVDALSGAGPVMANFTPDAVIDFSAVGFPRMEGEAEIRAFYDGLSDNMTHNFHMPANFRPAGWDGEIGIMEAYVTGMGQPVEGTPILVHVKYRMDSIQTAEGWKCQHFSLVPMMPTNA